MLHVIARVLLRNSVLQMCRWCHPLWKYSMQWNATAVASAGAAAISFIAFVVSVKY